MASFHRLDVSVFGNHTFIEGVTRGSTRKFTPLIKVVLSQFGIYFLIPGMEIGHNL